MVLGFLCLACSYKNQQSAAQTSQAITATTKTQNQDKMKQVATASKPGPVNTSGQVAPGSCRLVGEIVAIQSQLAPDRTSPCGKVPCKATVKVKKVIAYGAAFKPPLTEGQEISVYFAFTLSPSAAYFPNLTTPLPGLEVGSLFQADLKNPAEGGAATPDWYQVFTYIAI